jgi:hypothetical protein
MKPDLVNRLTRSPPLVPFTPSQRLDLNFAAYDLPFALAFTLKQKAIGTSLKLSCPSACPSEKALFFV